MPSRPPSAARSAPSLSVARGLELDAGDVAALSAATGLGLADVLARDTQDATTVVLGDLVELQETYVVRSAIPSDADHVRIEMLADDPRIWLLLGEAVSAPAPVSTDPLAEPLLPQISVLHAACQRIETGIEVAWSLSPARGARAYAAWLSYDGGVTREPLSNGAATAGRAPVRQLDVPVTVIAVAYGRTGLPGREVSTTFTTVAPVIAGSLIDISTLAPIEYANLGTTVRAAIDAGQAAAAAASQEAKNALAAANGRLDSFRRSLAADPAIRAGYVDSVMGDLRRDMSVIADATMRNLGKLAELQDTMAAAGIETVPAEGRVRIAALSRLETAVGTQITNLSVTLDALKGQIELYGSVQTGDLSGVVTSISTVQQRLDALNATVSTLATAAQVTDLSNRISSAQQTIDGQAATIAAKADLAVVTAQGSRLTQAESRTSALEGRVSSIVTAAGASATDTLLLPRLIGQLGEMLSQQIGAIQQNIARAETSISANVDEAGRSLGEVATRLLVFKGEATAQFETVTRAVADTNLALVQATTVYNAQIADVQASLVQEANTRATADSAAASAASALTARVGQAEGSLTTLQQAVANNASSTTTQFQGVAARFGTNEANLSNLATSTSNATSALSNRLDQVSARTDTANAGVASVSQAQASANAAQASTNSDLYARSGAGTAGGRVRFEAISTPSGVTARYSIQVSTEAGGQMNNSGLFIDILSNGQSRVVIDANYFLLTANGGLTYPFQFDGQTLTIPNLRVTQTALLPNAASDRLAPRVTNVAAGASSPDWREVPGTAVVFTTDDLWSSVFSATAQANVTANGSNSNFGSATLSFAIGVDGAPYNQFGAHTQQAGGGGLPNTTQSSSAIYNSPAQFEMTAANQSRRIAVLYKFQGGPIDSATILIAQLKVQTTKR